MLQCPSPWIVPEWLVYHLALWQSVLLPPASPDQNLPRSHAFLSTSCWQVEYRCCKTPQKRSPLWRRLGSILYLLLKLLGKRESVWEIQLLAEYDLKIGHMHDDDIWLQLPECTSLYADLCHARAILHKRKNCVCVRVCVRVRRANLRSCICEALTLLAIDLQYLTQHFGECHARACKRTLVVFTSTQVLENNLLSKWLT